MMDPSYLRTAKFVNVYLTDRAYGGPEEGGWWYDTAQAVRSTQVLARDLTALVETENAWCADENRRRRSDIGSVLSQGLYEVEIDDQPAVDRPTERPHYE
jgi:hypothetical protein